MTQIVYILDKNLNLIPVCAKKDVLERRQGLHLLGQFIHLLAWSIRCLAWACILHHSSGQQPGLPIDQIVNSSIDQSVPIGTIGRAVSVLTWPL